MTASVCLGPPCIAISRYFRWAYRGQLSRVAAWVNCGRFHEPNLRINIIVSISSPFQRMDCAVRKCNYGWWSVMVGYAAASPERIEREWIKLHICAALQTNSHEQRGSALEAN